MGVYKDLNDYEIMYMVSENDEDAKEVLLKKYYPIIKSTANKYKTVADNCGLEIEDLIQEGCFGLFCAINCYNPNRDAKFYTYATMSIKSKIVNALRTANSKKNICLNNYISLFKQIDYDNDAMLVDFIGDNNATYPEKIVSDNEIMIKLKEFIFTLDILNGSVFELKLNGFNSSDISDLIDIPSKRVSNIISRNNAKFRKFVNSQKI